MTVKELKRKLDSIILDTVNKTLTTEIGKQVVKQVRNRTQRGYGVAENNGKQQRLKPLKPATKAIRKGLAGKGQLSPNTSPGKSNLTRSGKMLNNINYTASENKVVVSVKGAQKIKAMDVSKERPFMNLSKTEINAVTKTVKEAIVNDIKKKGL